MPASESAPRSVPLVEFVRAAARRWLLLCLLMFGGAALLLGLSRLVTPRYEVKVIAMPRGGADRNSLLSSLAGQFGGIAALAGLTAGENAERAEAVQMLQSQTLAREFLQDNHLLPVIFADDWDPRRQAWRKRERTLNQGVKVFDGSIRGVIEDRRTGLITVRITWRDPKQAAEWANELVHRANIRLRERAIARAQKSLQYLQAEALKSDNVEIRQALYRLMEDQYKNLLLANVSEEYSFAVIDPAIAPDPNQYTSPNRALYILVGLFLGGLLGIAIVVFSATPRRPD